MKRILTRIGVVGAGLTIATSSVAGISASALSQTSSSNDPSTYIAPLHPLNRSGVSGMANLSLNDTQPGAALTASVNARGAEPNQVHAIHIHGMTDGTDAECPTPTADTNNDRLVSVFEGAPFYGPIKVSFTDPPTKFGPPSRTDLFAPFAGVPVPTDFPHSDANGGVRYSQTIPFDENNPYAVQALSSIKPLTAQHIVVHGGFAPESVDTPGGDPNKIVYDALLPIACGTIIQTHQGSAAAQEQNNNGHNSDSDSNAASISNTGPGSTNVVTNDTKNSTTVTNTNNVTSANSSSQSSSSGSASSNHNTSAGSARSGSARNSIQSLLSIAIKNN